MTFQQILINLFMAVMIVSVSFISVWLVTVLAQLNSILRDFNGVSSDIKSISASIRNPVNAVSEFLMGLKDGMKFFEKLRSKHFSKKSSKVKDPQM